VLATVKRLPAALGLAPIAPALGATQHDRFYGDAVGGHRASVDRVIALN
jgi:hypothetical protein